MSRMNHGPLTRTKGKLGGVVFQQYEGMQIAREYQPNVKNPQSAKQVENRAKFKSASQVIAQFADVINVRLSNYNIYSRIRRAAAVRATYNVFSSVPPDSVSAAVENVIAGLNNISLSAKAAPTIGELSSGNVPVTVPSGDTGYAIAVSYDDHGLPIHIEKSIWTSEGNPKNLAIDADAESYAVMACSTEALTEEGRATISSVEFSSDQWVAYITRAINEGNLLVSALSGAGDSI